MAECRQCAQHQEAYRKKKSRLELVSKIKYIVRRTSHFLPNTAKDKYFYTSRIDRIYVSWQPWQIMNLQTSAKVLAELSSARDKIDSDHIPVGAYANPRAKNREKFRRATIKRKGFCCASIFALALDLLDLTRCRRRPVEPKERRPHRPPTFPPAIP